MENKIYWISPDDNVVLWSEPFGSHSSTYKKVIVYDEYEKLQDKIYHLTREVERIEYEKDGYETMFNELKQENEILKSKASQFESTLLETIKCRDKLVDQVREYADWHHAPKLEEALAEFGK